ncbi:MAG TPA: aminotransferase class IV [Gemmatimonadaceae bacterium]|jgi:D-alanine transaminase|nr:aminotransferase class IV [Gemmatimonadaceae bacterium]
MPDIVYLNGQYIPRAEARVSVEDRAFLFGDGVYEVTRTVRGACIEPARHMRRLERGVAALQLPFPPAEAHALLGISTRLLAECELTDGEALVYWQVTRGAATRTHQFPPATTPPTVYVSAAPFSPPHSYRGTGVAAITVPDQRWARCDLKTVNLLPNVLAKQAAISAGAYEALLVRDGVVAEGSSTNLFGVIDGQVYTSPRTNYILPGVTREVVIELAPRVGLTVREEPMFTTDIPRLTELFVTGTTNDVMPVVTLDGRPVGDGRPGPVAARLYAALADHFGLSRGD